MNVGRSIEGTEQQLLSGHLESIPGKTHLVPCVPKDECRGYHLLRRRVYRQTLDVPQDFTLLALTGQPCGLMDDFSGMMSRRSRLWFLAIAGNRKINGIQSRAFVGTQDYGFLYPTPHQKAERENVIPCRPACSIISRIWSDVKRCSTRVPKRSMASVRIVYRLRVR